MGWLQSIFSKKERRTPESVDDSTFESMVLQAELPVVLDVWSPGCPPCQQLETVMMSLATDYCDRVRVCEMNATSAPRATSSLKVRATPTVLYFRGGELVERVMGFRGSLYHQQTIEEVFGVPHRAP
jgi:thioredoxin 1